MKLQMQTFSSGSSTTRVGKLWLVACFRTAWELRMVITLIGSVIKTKNMPQRQYVVCKAYSYRKSLLSPGLYSYLYTWKIKNFLGQIDSIYLSFIYLSAIYLIYHLSTYWPVIIISVISIYPSSYVPSLIPQSVLWKQMNSQRFNDSSAKLAPSAV